MTQLYAIYVLADLAEQDLPRLTWDVSSRDGAPLTGMPPHTADDGSDDEQRLAVLAEWAAHLDAEVKVTAIDGYTSHSLTTFVDGVRVRIFTHTDVTHVWVPVPTTPAEPGPRTGSADPEPPVVEQRAGAAPTGEAAAADRRGAVPAAATSRKGEVR